MISPFGLVTRPRMPAIWRICIQLPRAPESTIRKMVLSRWKFARIAWSTSLVASVQMSISSELRSASDTRPRSRFSCTWAALASNFAMISPLLGGATTSENAKVTPERVDHEKP